MPAGKTPPSPGQRCFPSCLRVAAGDMISHESYLPAAIPDRCGEETM